MTIPTLSKRDIDNSPYCVWNAFVDVLATEPYQDLTAEQRAAHLVFWYESEVQNGGHLQYFENRGTEHLVETVEALGLLGAVCQQQILQEARVLWVGQSRKRIETVAEFCTTALEGEFAALDSRFGKCDPSLQQR